MLRFRFRTLRVRLAVLYAMLFAVAIVGIAGVAQVIVQQTARASVMAELASSGTVYDRLRRLRSESLTRSAEVLASDFGFRTAVATGDEPTIASALETLRGRAGVRHAMLVDQEGKVTGAAGAIADALADVTATLPAGERNTAFVADGQVYAATLSPVLAPDEIGSVVFAVPLDAQEMRGLESLSAIPLTAAVLRRDAAGHWTPADGSLPADPNIDRLVAASAAPRPPTMLSLLNGDRSFALAKPLTGGDGRPVAALLIRYPFDLALAPYRPLQYGIGFAGVIGLLLVLLASGRLARSIARPIAALDAAARALEEGAHASVAVEGDDEIGRLAVSFNRMSAGIVEREHRITHLALHDTLTGLPNRAAFRQALDLAIGRSAHSGEPVAVLCLDLDGFKSVNDTLGHPVGDALLRCIGTMVRDRARDGFVARLGGDEIAIILSDGFDLDRPRILAQAIVDALVDPLQVDGHTIATGVSIGIALAPDDGEDADQLLKNADLALYRAKQDGRGVFRFFEPGLDQAARRRRQLELDLRNALRLGEFVLHYQPIVRLSDDSIGSAEALVRWEHPTRGLVSPGEFIPVAEETGLIVALGEWVLHEACRTAAHWPDHIRIAVNVSPLQFRAPGFPTVVMQALAQSGLSPQRLEIEITESIFLDGETTVVAMLHRLRDMGVRIALDDFGTGYSSLSYLRSFPFDKIKIDRSFVTPVADNPQAGAIVQAIIDLADALKMDTTAEGVEDDGQLAMLRSRGCRSIQGYLFSRPVTAERLGALIVSEARVAAAA